MELTPESLEAGRKAYEQALLDGGDPIAAALDAAFVELFKPITRDPGKKWSPIEARAVYHETVRPKTYTLYDDALKLMSGRHAAYNLYCMMSNVVAQTMHDLYTSVVNMGAQSMYPTEKDFVIWYTACLVKEWEQAERRQSIIDALKPSDGDME